MRWVPIMETAWANQEIAAGLWVILETASVVVIFLNTKADHHAISYWIGLCAIMYSHSYDCLRLFFNHIRLCYDCIWLFYNCKKTLSYDYLQTPMGAHINAQFVNSHVSVIHRSLNNHMTTNDFLHNLWIVAVNLEQFSINNSRKTL